MIGRVAKKSRVVQVRSYGEAVNLPATDATSYPESVKAHDLIVYTVNSLYLVQHMPNAKLILYPDASHGSWYENHEDFVFEANRFLDASDGIDSMSPMPLRIEPGSRGLDPVHNK
jgi:hypothetical protein